MAQQIEQPPQAPEQKLTMTYQEFLAWADEDIHAEWVDGEVLVFMPPKLRHQRLMSFLCALIDLFAGERNLGVAVAAPFEMLILQGRSSRQPDVLFVHQDHIARLSEDRLDGPADLVIELVSDSSTRLDRDEKYQEYQEAGIPEYIIIDPRPRRHRVEYYRLGEDGLYLPVLPDDEGRYHSAVLSGFWLDPAWLWQDPLPKLLDLAQELLAAQTRGEGA